MAGKPTRFPTLAALLITVATPPEAGAQDENAPQISNLVVDPDTGTTSSHYTITLRITDPQGPDDIDKTLYQLRQRQEVITLPINDAGEKGDRQADDGIYTAQTTVPPTAADGTHTFEVFVKDQSDHRSNILEYRFTVVDQNKVVQLQRRH